MEIKTKVQLDFSSFAAKFGDDDDDDDVAVTVEYFAVVIALDRAEQMLPTTSRSFA